MMPAYACSWVPADEAGVLHKHLAWLVKILLNMIPYQLPDMDLQASDTSFLPQELSCVSVTISLVSNVCITAVALPVPRWGCNMRNQPVVRLPYHQRVTDMKLETAVAPLHPQHWQWWLVSIDRRHRCDGEGLRVQGLTTAGSSLGCSETRSNRVVDTTLGL
eukprot:GHUV01038305.1.p1 GENE.GHUV01038305.1~~GHUV01038305.1.p1  ORF type:complete len:162 (-),score=13.79 GHUV01038305.1:21-506(-)